MVMASRCGERLIASRMGRSSSGGRMSPGEAGRSRNRGDGRQYPSAEASRALTGADPRTTSAFERDEVREPRCERWQKGEPAARTKPEPGCRYEARGRE